MSWRPFVNQHAMCAAVTGCVNSLIQSDFRRAAPIPVQCQEELGLEAVKRCVGVVPPVDLHLVVLHCGGEAEIS